MTTRAEQFKSDAERTHAAVPTTPSAPHAAGSGAVAKNATYAREEVALGTQPSRRSTRKSATHGKTDTGEARAERMKQAPPETQARRNRVASQSVRGGGAH